MSERRSRHGSSRPAEGPLSGPAGPETGEHVERLLPSPAMWCVTAALAGCAWAIVLPVDLTAAVVVALLVAAGVAACLLAASPVVGVDRGEVVAGRARLPVRHVGAVEALGRDETRRALGPELDARSMLRIRPWVHTAVRISLQDPDDPVPAWIVSTREPERFAGAIRTAKRSDPAEDPAEGVAEG